MHTGYIKPSKFCIKWTYSSQKMAHLPANDAIQVDELQQSALPDSRPLPINALLFGGDPHALAAAQPAIVAHSGRLVPPLHDVLIEAAQQVLPPLPNLCHGNHEDVAIVDTAMASAHSGDRYLHYGEENNVIDNGTAITAQSRSYQAFVFYSYSNSLDHVFNYRLLANLSRL